MPNPIRISLVTAFAIAGVAAFGQSFDGNNRLLIRFRDRRHARGRSLAVDQHSTGAALAFATAVLRAGQLQVFAQHIQQWPLRIGGYSAGLPVYGERDFRIHTSSLVQRQPRRDPI